MLEKTNSFSAEFKDFLADFTSSEYAYLDKLKPLQEKMATSKTLAERAMNMDNVGELIMQRSSEIIEFNARLNNYFARVKSHVTEVKATKNLAHAFDEGFLKILYEQIGIAKEEFSRHIETAQMISKLDGLSGKAGLALADAFTKTVGLLESAINDFE